MLATSAYLLTQCWLEHPGQWYDMHLDDVQMTCSEVVLVTCCLWSDRCMAVHDGDSPGYVGLVAVDVLEAVPYHLSWHPYYTSKHNSKVTMHSKRYFSADFRTTSRSGHASGVAVSESLLIYTENHNRHHVRSHKILGLALSLHCTRV